MSQVPDLVQDAELQTTFLDQHIVHTYTETGQTAQERAVVREEHWQRQRYIGGGAYGSVWLEKCTQGQRDLELRAVKEVTKSSQTSKRIDYGRELEAISKFSHPKYERCFVKSFGWYESQDAIYIAMEYFEHGDLHHLLYSLPPLPEDDAQRITFQVLEALDFMHTNGFAHRDLKPGNILVRSKPPDPWWIKLGDFGISKRAADNVVASSTVKGTLRYMAPELLEFVKPGTGSESAKAQAADMWALGEIAFQMLTKEPTFKSMNLLLMFVRSPKSFPSDTLRAHSVSQRGVEFIMKLMQPKPRDRATAIQALQDAWIRAVQTQTTPRTRSLSTRPAPSNSLTPPRLQTAATMPSGRWSTVSVDQINPPRLETSVSMPSGQWSTASMATATLRRQSSIADFFGKKPGTPATAASNPKVTPSASIEVPVARRTKDIARMPAKPTVTHGITSGEQTKNLPNERTIDETQDKSPRVTAKFFTVKSGSERDIETSAAHGIWSCGKNHNTRLSNEYNSTKYPVYLFFSVVGSRQFCGVAQMKSAWTRKITTEHWEETADRTGGFQVEWLVFKTIDFDDVKHLQHKEDGNTVSITMGLFILQICVSSGMKMMRRFGIADLVPTLASPPLAAIENAATTHESQDANDFGSLGVSALDLANAADTIPDTESSQIPSFREAEMLDRSQATTTSFSSTVNKRSRDVDMDDPDENRRKRT